MKYRNLPGKCRMKYGSCCRVPTSGLVLKSPYCSSEFFLPSTSCWFVFYLYFPYSITLVSHFAIMIHSFRTRDHFLSAYYHHQSSVPLPSSSLCLISCLSLPALLGIHHILILSHPAPILPPLRPSFCTLRARSLTSRTLTGGKPLFTHWIHGEYMVGSETKYPAWTHQVHFDYFLIAFTIYPQFTHPNTHWVHVEYFYKAPTQIPADWWIGYSCEFIEGLFKKYPLCDQNVPSGYLVSSLRVCGEIELHCEFFDKYPLGTLWSHSGYFLNKPSMNSQLYPIHQSAGIWVGAL